MRKKTFIWNTNRLFALPLEITKTPLREVREVGRCFSWSFQRCFFVIVALSLILSTDGTGAKIPTTEISAIVFLFFFSMLGEEPQNRWDQSIHQAAWSEVSTIFSIFFFVARVYFWQMIVLLRPNWKYIASIQIIKKGGGKKYSEV